MIVNQLIRKNIWILCLFIALIKCSTSIAQKNSHEYLNQLIENGSIKDIDTKTNKLEIQIDKICDSAIHFLTTYKKDTTINTYGLIQVFKSEKETYKERLADESELVFMSYGNIGKEERKVASDGYYYYALKEKYKFLQAMFNNTKDSIDPFGK